MEGLIDDYSIPMTPEKSKTVGMNHYTLHNKLHSSSPPCRVPVVARRCLAPAAATIAS